MLDEVEPCLLAEPVARLRKRRRVYEQHRTAPVSPQRQHFGNKRANPAGRKVYDAEHEPAL